jgi:hypothetical protein
MTCRGRKWRSTSEARTDIGELSCDCAKREVVSTGPRANHEVARGEMGQQFDSHDFSHASLQLVAIHSAVAMAWDDDPDPWRPERGSEMTDVEVPTPNSLPLSNDGFQFALARQPMLPRKASAIVRPRRTCSGGGPSGPCGPSCDGG